MALFGKKRKEAKAQEQLAGLIMERIEAAGQGGSMCFDAEEMCIRIADSDGIRTLLLDNAYTEYCSADSATRPKVVANYAKIAEKPQMFDVKSRLVLKVRPKCDRVATLLRLGRGLAQGRESGEAETPTIHDETLTWPLCEDLSWELAVDEGSYFRSICQNDLASCDLSPVAAFKLAVQNMGRILGHVGWEGWENGVFSMVTEDSLAASRLLFPSRLRELPIAGDPLVVIPNRNCLLVAGTDDIHAHEELVKWTLEEIEFDRPVRIEPLRLVGERFRPTSDDAALLGRSPWLIPLLDLEDELYERIVGPHIRRHLASLGYEHIEQMTLFELQPGMPATCTRCVDRPDEIIPRAAFVVFETGDTVAPVAWYKVIGMLGDALEPLEEYEDYYRVRRFPSSAELLAHAPTSHSGPVH